MRVTAGVAALFLVSVAPVWAQAPASGPEPAAAGTPEGAKAVVDGLVPYLGRAAFDTGIVKVEPDPAGYRLAIDAQPAIDKVKPAGTEFRISPYSIVISRRDDGNWNYYTDSKLDMAMKVTVAGRTQETTYDIGPQRFKGVFSPEVASLLSGSGTVEGLTMRSLQDTGDVSATMGPMSFDITGTPVAAGMLDFAMKQTGSGFTESVALKEEPGMPPGGIRFDVKSGTLDATTSAKALRSRAIADLYSFFISHPEYFTAPGTPDQPKLAGSQADLKGKLRAALPLWDKLHSGYTLAGISVDSQYAKATMDRLTVSLSTDGVAKAGTLRYAFGFDGLGVTSAAIPAWAATLMPKSMALNMRVDNLDLQTPAEIALADLDVGRPEPLSADAQTRIGVSFTDNPPRFVLEPSSLKAADLQLDMAGSFAASNGKPAATVDITATGFDTAIATLQTAAQTQPEINQVIGGLSMAKGFGKQLPDGRIQWVVDAASDGSVKVNGFQVKGPEPVVAPDPGDGGMSDDMPMDDAPADQAPTDDNAVPDAPPQQ
ncbi:DUF2125 domain-containing protein [Aureimonas leprariae]|uniref:DUF2125 domain-containing protein n=1 Tax=Plantimonas leprariae TaxID=2615207 RepID=A0A7V7PPU5_9HYPH|nr:DUF2125 domain-containing protein [Aureimonas leprariae]KAB0680123.1 DUF2125 domain-containing protein [Aureimonas leprariae]